MFPDTEIKSTEEPRSAGEPYIIESEKIELYEVTAYTIAADENGRGDGITASGVLATPYVTCACNDYPFGTRLEIDGQIWIVEDRMAEDGHIDLCMDTKEACYDFGRRVLEVKVLG